ncbi:hypothetical protein [Miniimonas arenae]|uniref:hypothetical protein n=1 Tax=Miniimonas arenae TaxID=676201 RepID=UPI0028B09A2F|nr:hypothetical protein [Miniimonas arenae]
MTQPNPSGSRLLKDVLDIPTSVHADDFVLQLGTGVTTKAAATLSEYVVTEAITGAFADALDLVAAATARGDAKGAFIHGSFGAGKSHFMAVLNLLLAGNPHARTLPGLAPVIADRGDLLAKRYLTLDYHLLGKESLEHALFEGYLRAVAVRHPDVKPPVLHRSGALLVDAAGLRATLGEERFFESLGGADDGWGTQSAGWDAASYEAAEALPPGDPEHQRLVADLVEAHFTSYRSTGQWLEIAEGLRVLTAHAQQLGYDGVVLFLDELVLWLAQHLGDQAFIQSEASKVTKLIETEGRLALPLISFVARQRELKEFLGAGAVGAERESLGDSLQFFEGRFDSISLAAADLPEIAKKRILTPTSPQGEELLRAAVDRVRADGSAASYLMESADGFTGADFAKVYPFSPALVDAMVALSTLLQRERTALKIMTELLSDGRDELTVDDVIPVGDLFDAVVLGDSKPLTKDMQQRFAIAAKLYTERFRPYVLGKYGLTEQAARAVNRHHAFHTEDRLLKTLLVAEIAPGAASLKNLTPAKLAALNYGSVQAFVPGMEAQAVMAFARAWDSEFSEVTVGAGAQPVLGVQLSGIDYDSVLDRVRGEDNHSNRRRVLRGILEDELGVRDGAALTQATVAHVWRGRRSDVEILFGNVRDRSQLGDQAFTPDGSGWRVVVDYPFDDTVDRSPADDVARVQELLTAGVEASTVVWIPHFLASGVQEKLGTLVVLEYLLTGDHFDQAADNLPPSDREPARRTLTAQRDALRSEIRTALLQAYGLEAPGDAIGARVGPGDTFRTLTRGLEIQTPGVTTLKEGLAQVLDQALAFTHPRHPDLDNGRVEVRPAELTAVLELVQRARAGGGRLEGIERSRLASARRIIDGLGLGTLRENVLVVGAATFRWNDRFQQWAGSGTEVSVRTLRDALAEYGMAAEVESLLILTWAAIEDRDVVRYGAVEQNPQVTRLAPDAVLREPVLPEESAWREALARAKAVFGVGGAEHHLSSAALQRVVLALRQTAKGHEHAANGLVQALTPHAALLDLDVPEGRLHTARRALDLCRAIASESDAVATIDLLAAFDLGAAPSVVARSLSTAAEVAAEVRGASWGVLDELPGLGEGTDVLSRLRETARAEQLHAAIGPALERATSETTRILVAQRAVPTQVPTPVPGREAVLTPDSAAMPGIAPAPGLVAEPQGDPAADGGAAVVDPTPQMRLDSADALEELRARLAREWPPGRTLRVSWRWE